MTDLEAARTDLIGSKAYGDYYRVFPDGRVASVRKGTVRFLKGGIMHGYTRYALTVGGFTKSKYAHQLVGELFIPRPPDTTMVCHRNGDPADTRIENLYWGTAATNTQDALHHGTFVINDALRRHGSFKYEGSKNGQSKLTETDARQILAFRGIKNSIELAKQFGVHKTTIARIWRKEAWTHVL